MSERKKSPQEEYIINPRPEVRRAIEKGEKDVWYLNDTHWSPVGAKIAADWISKKLVDISSI